MNAVHPRHALHPLLGSDILIQKDRDYGHGIGIPLWCLFKVGEFVGGGEEGRDGGDGVGAEESELEAFFEHEGEFELG